MTFKETITHNIDLIGIFIVLNAGCFFGTLNKSWGFFLFNLILTTIGIFLLIKFGAKK